MSYTITHIHYRGEGIATDETGRQIRIANTLAGETVEATDVSVMRRRQAVLDKVIVSAKERCLPVCPHWHRCPACQFQCMTDDAQCELKSQNWVNLIQKITPESADCSIQFTPARKKLAYRHRTEATVFCHQLTAPVLGIAPRLDIAAQETRDDAQQRGDTSFQLSELEPADIFENGHYHPVPLKACALHAPELNQLITQTETWLAEIPLPHGTVIGFEAFKQNSRVVIHTKPEHADSSRQAAHALFHALTPSFPGICLILQVLPPRGSHVYPKPEAISESPWYGYGQDMHGDMLYALKGAWTPVNPDNAAIIRDTLVRMISNRTFKTALELGCGCGTHASIFARHAEHYIGIDASWPAILSAQYNAEQNHWPNTTFFTDTAEHFLHKRYKKGMSADAILMHSNRMPYSEKTAQLCVQFGAQDLYIVAPTAYAMAQECRHFIDLGFKLHEIVICDTLPMTYHGMAVAYLSFCKSQ